jgi:hypothetical protein
VKRLVSLAALLLAIGAATEAAACAQSNDVPDVSEVVGPVETQPPARPTSADCSGLDSQLLQLLNAADPAEFSASHALPYRVGEVRVQIELAVPDSLLAVAQNDLVLDYQLAGDVRYRNFLQAWAPVDALCALANDGRVRSVNAPPAPSVLVQ